MPEHSILQPTAGQGSLQIPAGAYQVLPWSMPDLAYSQSYFSEFPGPRWAWRGVIELSASSLLLEIKISPSLSLGTAKKEEHAPR